jgi:Mono-functional DNA-alkylating methyl methanesulfonate N-term/CPSF A subunit region
MLDGMDAPLGEPDPKVGDPHLRKLRQHMTVARPGLFVKTVLPASAVSHTVPCEIVPADVLEQRLSGTAELHDAMGGANMPIRTVSHRPVSLSGTALGVRSSGIAPTVETRKNTQLIVSTETSIYLYAVDPSTSSLLQITSMPVFSRVRGLAVVSHPGNETQVLVVLLEASKVSFVEYNIQSDALICTGSVSITGLSEAVNEHSPRNEARFIVSHPRRNIVAVASLNSTVSVFPILTTASKVCAGTVVSKNVDGVIISLDFIEDEDDADGRSILIALCQEGSRQHISVLTVNRLSEDNRTELSLTCLASVGTCATRQDDAAVARAQFKLTGEPIKPPRTASAVSRMSGCPYTFAVFLEGRIVAADLFFLLKKSRGARNHPVVCPRSVHDLGSSCKSDLNPADIWRVYHHHDHERTDIRISTDCEPNIPDPLPPAVHEDNSYLDTSAGVHSIAPAPAMILPSNPSSPEDESTTAIGVEQGSAVHVPLNADTVSVSRSNAPTLDSHDTYFHVDGAGMIVTDGLSADPTGTTLRSHQQDDRSGNSLTPDDLQRRQPLSNSVNRTEPGHDDSPLDNSPDRFSSGVHIPAHVGLDIGEGHEGRMIAFADARCHFETSVNRNDDNPDRFTDSNVGALYFATEEGTLFALRWHEKRRTDGVPSFVIPAEYDCSVSDRIASRGCLQVIDGIPLFTRRERYFSLDVVGYVGPAISMSALDLNLLYIANDGADGSLRRIGVPSYARIEFLGSRYAQPRLEYSLQVRQEFLNLAPISDFVLVPHPKADPSNMQCDCRRVPRCKRSSVSSGRHSGCTCVTCSAKLRTSGKAAYIDMAAGSSQERGFKRGRSSHLPVYRGAPECDLGSHQNKDTFKSLTGHGAQFVNAGGESAGGTLLEIPPPTQKSTLPMSISKDLDCLEQISHDQDLDLNELTSSRCESKLIACSGLGPNGTIRILRPGTAVSLFSSSAPVFPSCNHMWSLRPTRGAQHHIFIVLTFADSTGVFLPAPCLPSKYDSGSVARLLDVSTASSILLHCRTIAIGRVQDGMIAQVHRQGVRLVELARASELSEPVSEVNGAVSGPLARATYDWNSPDSSIVSVGCVGIGYVVLCLMKPGQNPRIALLQLRESKPNSVTSGLESRLHVIDIADLESEFSCLEFSQWSLDCEVGNFGTRSIIVAGTYLPSVEVWSVGPKLARVWTVALTAWSFDVPSACDGQDRSEVLARPGLFLNDHHAGRPSFGVHRRHAIRSSASDVVSRKPNAMPFDFGSVTESVCAVELCNRQFLFVGSRDGYVIQFDVNHGCSGGASCFDSKLVSRRQLGKKPVRISVVSVGFGKAVLAEAERPWLGFFCQGRIQWTPLNLFETRAGTALSVPGAERCIAFVGVDDSVHICGVRQACPTSVSTIHVGSTPRRVLALDSASERIVVLSTFENRDSSTIGSYDGSVRKSSCLQFGRGRGFYRRARSSAARPGSIPGDGIAPVGLQKFASCAVQPVSDIRLYSCATGQMECRSTLLPGELAHVLLKLSDFVAVGTSFDIRKSVAQHEQILEKGRLLLYTTLPYISQSSDVGSMVVGAGLSRRHIDERVHSCNVAKPKYLTLGVCCEVILPGAILAGAVSSCQEVLVVSSNEQVFVFGLSRARSALVEVARTSMRSVVVSISVGLKFISVADQKDSIAFYRLDAANHRLIRDRGDKRKRTIACVVMVDDCTAIACDKRGALFSLAFDERDIKFLPHNDVLPRMSSLVPTNLFSGVQLQESSQEHDLSSDEPHSPTNYTSGHDTDMQSNDGGTYGIGMAGSSNVGTQSMSHHESDDGHHSVENNAAMVHSENLGSEQDTLSGPILGVRRTEAEGEASGVSNEERHASGNTFNDSAPEAASSDHALTGETTNGQNALNVDCGVVSDDAADAGDVDDHMDTGYENNDEQGIEEPEQDHPGVDITLNTHGGVEASIFTVEPDNVDDELHAEAYNQDGSGTGDDNDDGDESDGSPAGPGDSDEIEVEDLLQPIQRNLASNHSFNMNDTALRLRVGSIARFESRGLWPENDDGTQFWTSGDANVVAGTLSGAIVVAVPVGLVELTVLMNVMQELASHVEAVGLSLGGSQNRFRSVYGADAAGCADGDTLELYGRLPLDVQIRIASAAGYPGEDNAHRISALIQRMCDIAQ